MVIATYWLAVFHIASPEPGTMTPIATFTLELGRRDDSAPSLWVVAHDLVNVGHVAGHERRCVEAQARVHVRGPRRGDQSACPGGVPLEAGNVRDVAPARVQGVAGGLREERRRHRGENAGHREP